MSAIADCIAPEALCDLCQTMTYERLLQTSRESPFIHLAIQVLRRHASACALCRLIDATLLVDLPETTRLPLRDHAIVLLF